MSIVPMKHIRVMALATERERLLAELLHLGCVEISEPQSDSELSAFLSRDSSLHFSAKSAALSVRTALDAIKKYGKTKDGLFAQRPELAESAFLDEGAQLQAKEKTAVLNDNLAELSRLQGEENRLSAARASLLPWSNLALALECSGTEHVSFLLAVCPAGGELAALTADLDASGAAAALYEISGDRAQRYLFLVCHKADEALALETLRPYSLSLASFKDLQGTARENILRVENELAANRARQETAIAAIAAEKDARGALREYLDRLAQDESLEHSRDRILTDGTIVFFDGWAPKESMAQLEELFKKLDCAWEASDPTEEEIPAVPVRLKNNVLTRPLNMVTEMYSLPAYNGVDPNPLMAPFFILFYGIMMADMGYGTLMMLASLIVLKKIKPKEGMKHFFSLLGLCGIATFLMGAVTGGFFGDFLPQLAKVINPETTFTGLPALFTPLDDTLAILVGSMVLGCVQILTGMTISFIKQTREGHFLDALMDIGSWWLVFIGIGVGALAGNWLLAIAGVVALVATQGRSKPTLIGKLVGGIGSLYDITGYFGDVLSYSRLMALMLAGSVIAQVFNTLGAIPGNVVIFILISMAGNALNFALNLLGCYVHDLRLQCLEYFGKFYQDGGKPFKPLAIKTKFVDIIQ